MFRARRSSSLSSTVSSANPALSSVTSSGGSYERSATLSSLSVAAIAASAVPGNQHKTDRPMWKRLTKRLSQTLLGVKSNKKLALPPVKEDSALDKEIGLSTAARDPPIHVLDAHGSSQDQRNADGCTTEPAREKEAAEDEYVSRTAKAVSTIAERDSASTSPALRKLLDAIPADLPLIQYVAECLLADGLPGSSREDEHSKDVESQLFFKSLELKKWTLAQVLAEKIQRRVAFRHQHSTKEDSDCQIDKERTRLRSSDVVLSFLDTCSA